MGEPTVVIEKDMPVPMRDGVVLRADVFRPAAPGRYPVILQRTPYNKNLTTVAMLMLDVIRTASEGYNEWPLARTRYTKYYFHSGGKANGLRGDGLLSPEPPRSEPADVYVADPRNPVPTRGGGLCCWPAAVPGGAFDQRPVEERADVLVYTTPVLAHDVEVTGPAVVTLYAATSAVDADFTAKPVDVHPDGYARNLTDGIIRGRYREAKARETLLKSGEVYEYTIDVWATSNVFKAGHRIRVEIASANFPRFDRNPQTGERSGEASQLEPALQRVFHDELRPSHIVLPIIAS